MKKHITLLSHVGSVFGHRKCPVTCSKEFKTEECGKYKGLGIVRLVLVYSNDSEQILLDFYFMAKAIASKTICVC